jgi:hypothetical protein
LAVGEAFDRSKRDAAGRIGPPAAPRRCPSRQK